MEAGIQRRGAIDATNLNITSACSTTQGGPRRVWARHRRWPQIPCPRRYAGSGVRGDQGWAVRGKSVGGFDQDGCEVRAHIDGLGKSDAGVDPDLELLP